jgi:hypothetical protein
MGNTTTAERGSGDTATNASSSGAANGSPLTRPSSFQPISTAILRSATGGAATSATFTSIAPTRSLVMARGDMSAIGVKLHSRQMFTDVPSSLEPLDMPLSESIVLADAFHIRDPGQLL